MWEGGKMGLLFVGECQFALLNDCLNSCCHHVRQVRTRLSEYHVSPWRVTMCGLRVGPI